MRLVGCAERADYWVLVRNPLPHGDPFLRSRTQRLVFQQRPYVRCAAMTISDDEAAELAELQQHYKNADAQTAEARNAYYDKLLELDAKTAVTYDDIAAVLGVHRSRVGQLVAQARERRG